MIWLILAIIFGVLLYVCFRIIGILKLDEFQVIVSNYLTAVLLGTLLWRQPVIVSEVISYSWFPVSVIIGISFFITFYIFTLSTEKAGMAITAVSSKMSVILPVLAGFIYFGDSLDLYKISGIIIALFSFILVLLRGNRLITTMRFMILPALIFLGTGINDTLLKYVHHFFLANDNTLFITTLFLISFVSSFIFIIVKFIIKSGTVSIKSLMVGIILGIINFGGIFFMLQGLDFFEASFFFPVLSTCVVLITSIIAMIVFREKLSFINWIGIIMAITSIILISGV